MITIWGAFMASMPGPIVGGLYLTVFGLIAAVGVSVVSMADMKSSRNLFIIGIAMFAGLAIPNMAGAMDPWLQSLPLSIRWAGDILKVIAETGMAVTAFIAIFLDNIIPGTPEERGITHPEWAGE
jgi:xanthine/uracil permease